MLNKLFYMNLINTINTFKLIFIYLIIDNLQYIEQSNLILINIILWGLIVIFNNPLLLHYIHLIGIFQCITGWVWMNDVELIIYRKLLFILWGLFIIRKNCIVNEVIKERGKNYSINFTNNQVIVGVPILWLFSYYKNYFN